MGLGDIAEPKAFAGGARQLTLPNGLSTHFAGKGE
jgi:hypothetical protein